MSRTKLKEKKYLFILAFFGAIVGSYQVSEIFAEELDLKIQPARATYVMAEPVIIHITLSNKSRSTLVKVSPELTLESDLISIYIAGPGNNFQPYHSGVIVEPNRPRKDLKPSEEMRHDQLILYNMKNKDFAFSVPGMHRIKIIFYGFGEYPDVESNEAQIQVLEPSGVNAAALALFKNVKVAELIMNMGEAPKAIHNLETLIKKYDDSEYAPYARYYLARRESHKYLDRKPNYFRATKLLEDLVKPGAKMFQLTDKAMYLQSKVYFKLGEINKGENILKRLIKNHPKSIKVKRSEQILRKY